MEVQDCARTLQLLGHGEAGGKAREGDGTEMYAPLLQDRADPLLGLALLLNGLLGQMVLHPGQLGADHFCRKFHVLCLLEYHWNHYTPFFAVVNEKTKLFSLVSLP